MDGGVAQEAGPEPQRPQLRSIPGGRQMPQNAEAEEAVIGGILLNGRAALHQVADTLQTGEDFSHPVLRTIYEAMLELDNQQQPIDLITVAEHLRASGEMYRLASYNREAYLAELANRVATVENIAYHARIVRDKSLARQVILTSDELTVKSYAPNATPGDARAAALHLLELSRPGDWPEPMPLTGGLLPVPALTEDMVPEALRPWISDIAERMQCPLEYPTVGALVGAGALIGRQIAVRPKERDNWTEYASLWGMLVGPPGVLKSPALKEALKPIRDVQRIARREFAEALEIARIKEVARRVLERQIEKQIEERVKKDSAGQMHTAESVEELEEKLRDLQPKEVIERRYMTSDATVEKLVVLLQENPNGMLIYRDELRGLLLSFERYGHESDRPFYLEGWTGDASYTSDRVVRGGSHVEGVCLSLIGTIQPGPLVQYLRHAAAGCDNDGFMQRFQLAVYPDVPKTKEIDRWPNVDAQDRVCDLYRRLTKLDPFDLGAEVVQGKASPPFLRFSPEAQDFARPIREDYTKRAKGEDDAAMGNHLNKFQKLFPTLALIFHLLDCVDTLNGGRITLVAAQRAAAWCKFLEAHARRLYWLARSEEQTPASALARRIQSGALGDRFRARDVYIRHWAALPDDAAVRAACNELIELGWLRAQATVSSRGGRPPRGGSPITYLVNPRIKVAAEEAAKAAKGSNPEGQGSKDQTPKGNGANS